MIAPALFAAAMSSCPGLAEAAAADPSAAWKSTTAAFRRGTDVARMALPIVVEGDRLFWGEGACAVELAPAGDVPLTKTPDYPDDLLNVRTIDPDEVRHVALLAQGTVRARVHTDATGRATRIELLESSVGPLTAGRDPLEENGARGALRLRFAIAALLELRDARFEPGASVEVKRVFLVPTVELSTLPGAAPRGYR